MKLEAYLQLRRLGFINFKVFDAVDKVLTFAFKWFWIGCNKKKKKEISSNFGKHFCCLESDPKAEDFFKLGFEAAKKSRSRGLFPEFESFIEILAFISLNIFLIHCSKSSSGRVFELNGNWILNTSQKNLATKWVNWKFFSVRSFSRTY